MDPPARVLKALEISPASAPYLAAFLMLSDGREYAVGMGGAIPRRITFTEIEHYGRIYGFARSRQDLQDFAEIIRRIDTQFIAHAAAKTKAPPADDDDEDG